MLGHSQEEEGTSPCGRQRARSNSPMREVTALLHGLDERGHQAYSGAAVGQELEEVQAHNKGGSSQGSSTVSREWVHSSKDTVLSPHSHRLAGSHPDPRRVPGDQRAGEQYEDTPHDAAEWEIQRADAGWWQRVPHLSRRCLRCLIPFVTADQDG